MPEQYERVRDSYVKRGVPLREAKRRAAMWWNKTHREKNPWLREESAKPAPKRSSRFLKEQ